MHYLGVIVPMLLAQPPSGLDRAHAVRLALGAGCEPQLHAAFEVRFGFPLLELWGMTEMVRVLSDCTEPRQVGTRAFGRPVPGVDVRIVDDSDRDVPEGAPGEMVIRHSAETPRRGAFSGYLKNDVETEKSWRGGWFHTGDTVYRATDGMLHFVDRKKNIIRRSGENIAAAEIEALLLTHPEVLQAAVLPVHDEVREEEVLACIVLKSGGGDRATPRRFSASATSGLPTTRHPAGSGSRPNSRPPVRRKFRSTRSFLASPTRAPWRACSIFGVPRSGRTNMLQVPGASRRAASC